MLQQYFPCPRSPISGPVSFNPKKYQICPGRLSHLPRTHFSRHVFPGQQVRPSSSTFDTHLSSTQKLPFPSSQPRVVSTINSDFLEHLISPQPAHSAYGNPSSHRTQFPHNFLPFLKTSSYPRVFSDSNLLTVRAVPIIRGFQHPVRTFLVLRELEPTSPTATDGSLHPRTFPAPPASII